MRWGLAFFGVIASGCSPDPEPTTEWNVSSYPTLGVPSSARVVVEQRTHDCRAWAGGDVLKCESVEKLPGTIVSLRCEPAEACGEITIGREEASWVSLDSAHALTLVADTKIGRMERTFSISPRAPEMQLERLSNWATMQAGSPQTFCLGPIYAYAAPQLVVPIQLEASIDGVPLEVENAGPDTQPCGRVLPPRSGMLHVDARLAAGTGVVASRDEIVVEPVDAAVEASPQKR